VANALAYHNTELIATIKNFITLLTLFPGFKNTSGKREFNFELKNLFELRLWPTYKIYIVNALPNLSVRLWERRNVAWGREYETGKYQCTIDLLFDWFGIRCMTTDNFCFYLQNRQIQTSETGGQWYSDTSSFSIPCLG
jgi:hypothetical protein